MKITVNDDFDLYKIAYSGQTFRARQLNTNTYRFITGNHAVTISAENLGDKTNLMVSCPEKEWDVVWHDYFDLDTCYRDIRHSIPPADKFLQNCAELGKGIRILRQNKFETLISFIISQRKSIPAIKKSVEGLCTRFGESTPTDYSKFSADYSTASSDCNKLYFFPNAEQLANASESELIKCGLGYRLPYIVKACERICSGEINLDELDELSDDELIDTLKSFYGVGDKVANCVALFSYHRTGLAPVDTWIKKIIETKYNGINPFLRRENKSGKTIPSSPNAGIMQQYMFYAAQHLKSL